MPKQRPTGHKGGAHGGSKGVAREFEKLSVSKRDSPVRHPSRNRTIRPGQLQKVRRRPPPRSAPPPSRARHVLPGCASSRLDTAPAQEQKWRSQLLTNTLRATRCTDYPGTAHADLQAAGLQAARRGRDRSSPANRLVRPALSARAAGNRRR